MGRGFLNYSLFLLLFLPTKLYASVTLTGVTGYSNIKGFTGANTESGAVQIFGGVAGPACTGSSVIDTCNSCTSATGAYTACNEKRIYSSLQITFSFKGTKAGYARITTDADTGAAVPDPVGTVTLRNAGETHTYTTTWGELCTAIDPDHGTSCEAVSSNGTNKINFRIGIDVPTTTTSGDGDLNSTDEYIEVSIGVYGATTGGTTLISGVGTTLLADEVDVCATEGSGTAKEGICNFEVFPGDKKITVVAAIPPTSDFPNAAQEAKFEKLRIYYAKGTAPSASDFTAPGFSPCTMTGTQFSSLSALSDHSDLPFTTTTNGTAVLSSPQVTGLENGSAYFFRAATIDEAGNISSFSPGAGGGDCTCYESTSLTCHFAVPSKVLGLAADEFDCFIASAIYDSPLAPEVQTLRKFRNKILKSNMLGRFFIKQYYTFSPNIAHWLNGHKYIKQNFKYLFWPIVLWAKCCVKFGFLKTQLMLTLILLLFMYLNRIFSPNRKLKMIWLVLFLLIQTPNTLKAADLIFGDDEPQEIQKDKVYDYQNSQSVEAPPLEPPYTQQSQLPINQNSIPKPQSIDEDGTHYYQIDTPQEDSNWYFKAGVYGPFNITNASTNKTYEQVYTSKPQIVMVMEYEWKVVKWLGDLGLKLGTGISLADGKGQFIDEINSTLTPKETYQFLIFPNTAVITYHLRIGHRPWLVPYFQGGGGYYTFWEKRSDGAESKFGGTPVVTVGGGLLLSVNAFDSDAAITLSRDYGVNRFWIDLHVDRVQAFNSQKNFSANMFTAGIGMGF